MRGLLQVAMRIAIAASHPAYDCIYLALALANRSLFVTADDRLIHKLQTQPDKALSAAVVSLADASAGF
jgi:predicted nucleic acid-binding protein